MSVTKRVRSLLNSLLSPQPVEQNGSTESLNTLDNVGPNMRRAMIRARNKPVVPTAEEHSGVQIAKTRTQGLRGKTAQ